MIKGFYLQPLTIPRGKQGMGKGRVCCWLHIQLKRELTVSRDTFRISYTSNSHSTTHKGPLFPLYISFNFSWFAMFLGNFKQN